jgi:hypothetical protein
MSARVGERDELGDLLRVEVRMMECGPIAATTPGPIVWKCGLHTTTTEDEIVKP